MNKTNILGVYSFNINISTMFNEYKMKVTNHNLITNVGERYFLERWVSNNSDVINRIGLVQEDTVALKTDTELPDNTNLKEIDSYHIEPSKLILKLELVGSELDGVNGIGVLTKDNKLISHDTSFSINVPPNSIVNVDYQYILTDGAYINEWILYDSDENIYKYESNLPVKYIVEEDTNIGYSLSENKTNLTENSYCVEEENNKYIIYIKTSDNLNPNQHLILITYN